jgi:hypothetical protein
MTQVCRLSALPPLACDICRKDCGEVPGRGHFVSPAARRTPSMRTTLFSAASRAFADNEGPETAREVEGRVLRPDA